MDEMKCNLVRRLDISICQALSGIVEIISTTIKWHQNLSFLFKQFEQCG